MFMFIILLLTCVDQGGHMVHTAMQLLDLTGHNSINYNVENVEKLHTGVFFFTSVPV